MLTILIIAAVCGALASSLATAKGHSSAWFWAGFCLGLIGVVWAALLPRLNAPEGP